MIRMAAGIVGLVCVVLSAAAPWLVRELLNGQWGLFAALLLSIVTFVSLYLLRGVLGGYQRFTGYAVTFATEGFMRLAPLIVLEVLHFADAVGYGLIFAAGGAWATIAGLPWLRRRQPAAALLPASGSRLGRSFTLLLLSSMLMQVMANLAPVVAVYRMPDRPELAAILASAFVLARIPLFIFSPVQTMLLPRLVTAVARGDGHAIRRGLGLALGAVGAVGFAGVAGSALLGPWVLTAFFGARADVPGWVLPLLAVGTTLLMTVQVLQPALLAAGRNQVLLAAWAAGSLCMLATALLPVDAAGAAVMAQLLGSAVVVAVAGAAVLASSGGGSIISGWWGDAGQAKGFGAVKSGDAREHAKQ